jgi:hypothetical protein
MARIDLTDPPTRIECNLAGVSHRQEVLRELPKTTRAALVREPQNPHDPNAIGVYVDGRHVGYVPRDEAQWISSVMEHGEWTYACPHMRVGWWDEKGIFTASIILERRRPNPDLIGSEHRPSEHRPSEHRPSEHRPSEHRPSEHRPSEHRPKPPLAARLLALFGFGKP